MDRATNKRGGVALLITTKLNPTLIPHKVLPNVEWVGARVEFPTVGSTDILSIYCPAGDATKEVMSELLNRRNEFVVISLCVIRHGTRRTERTSAAGHSKQFWPKTSTSSWSLLAD